MSKRSQKCKTGKKLFRMPFSGGGQKDVVILLDASSSMGGGWLNTCKGCVRELCNDHLQPGDTASLLVFNHQIQAFVEPQIWPENREALSAALGQLR